ncbi:DegV family protein [Corynebacterium hansenii]|uniref:DegV family protein n=1 Tax=Corynebacterium hansenii TaxID=394964 RepID=A0ABV7ZN12_9CORY|nr:DegV family protein [Corynebacterium hansenii]WJY99378.1 DegV domain-containing protein [Corynebacterium hansenii]
MTGAGEKAAGRVQVVVDESACVEESVAKRHGITVVPLGLDDVDGEQTTSAIGPLPLCAAYARALERGGDAGVVALHLGKGLSATWSNAVTAAAVLERVTVVDTSMVGAGMGAAAVAAAKKAAEGADLEECVAVAEDVLRRNRLWLYVPKLEPLRRGGRISTGQAVLSTALAIKPIVGIQDGTLGLVAKCRTEAKVLDKLVVLAAAEAAGRPAHVMLHHSGARERVEELHAMLSLKLPKGSTFDIVDLPPALVAHTGPGAYAVGMVVAEEVGASGGAGAAGAAGVAGVAGAAGVAGVAGAGGVAGAAGAGAATANGAGANGVGANGVGAGNGAANVEGANGAGETFSPDAASGVVAGARADAAGSGDDAVGADGKPLPPTSVVGRESSALFTTVAAKLPTWSENRRAAIEKAEALAHAIAELARRDHSDPEGAAFGRQAREEAARKAAERANGDVDDDGADNSGTAANGADNSGTTTSGTTSSGTTTSGTTSTETTSSGSNDVAVNGDAGGAAKMDGEGDEGGVVKQ